MHMSVTVVHSLYCVLSVICSLIFLRFGSLLGSKVCFDEERERSWPCRTLFLRIKTFYTLATPIKLFMISQCPFNTIEVFDLLLNKS